MATRLDRLLVLLDSGSTPATRKTAAQQLGEVQRLHPDEMPTLFRKVSVYLKSRSWDTRVAAAQAVEAIALNYPKWDPTPVPKAEDAQGSKGEETDRVTLMQLNPLNVKRVLQHAKPLLGSSGEEFEIIDQAAEAMTVQERLSHQKQLLKKRLGLDFLEDDKDELLNDEDIAIYTPTSTSPVPRSSLDKPITEVVTALDPGLSSRERNRAKRKAKIIAKQRTREGSDSCVAESSTKKPRTDSVTAEVPRDPEKLNGDTELDASIQPLSDEWPFKLLCAELTQDMFHTSWEVRHGAVSALREIVKVHGGGAGKALGMTQTEMTEENAIWLEDMAFYLVLLLALDRFVDYVSDESVAPVREVSAQTLGATLHHMRPDRIGRVLECLLSIQDQDQWHVRHGGLLGLKYALAVCKKYSESMLQSVYPCLLTCLCSAIDDDVRSTAASALVSVIDDVVKFLGTQVRELLTGLWDLLIELDDLTSYTSNVMILLASLLNHVSKLHDRIDTDLDMLVPRLWKFFSHPLQSVRTSVLNAVSLLIQPGVNTQWLLNHAVTLLGHLLRRVLVEGVGSIQSTAYKVLTECTRILPIELVYRILLENYSAWYAASVSSAAVPFVGLTENTQVAMDCSEERSGSEDFVGGSPFGVDPAVRESFILRARILGSRALGMLLARTSVSPDWIGRCAVLREFLMNALRSSSGTQRFCCCFTLSEWVSHSLSTSNYMTDFLAPFVPRLSEVLTAKVMYEELVPLYMKVQQDCRCLADAFKEYNLDIFQEGLPGLFTLEAINLLMGNAFESGIKRVLPKYITSLECLRQSLQSSFKAYQMEMERVHSRVTCAVSGAMVGINGVVDKLNPILRPLMDGIRKEPDSMMRVVIAGILSRVLEGAVNRDPCPNPKAVKNLIAYSCADFPLYAGLLREQQTRAAGLDQDDQDHSAITEVSGILTLLIKQRENGKLAGGKVRNIQVDNFGPPVTFGPSEDEKERALRIEKAGGETALKKIAEHFASALWDRLPSLHASSLVVIENMLVDNFVVVEKGTKPNTEESWTVLCSAVRVIEVLVTNLHSSLLPQVVCILPALVRALSYPSTTVRHIIARCLGVLAQCLTDQVLQVIVQVGLPLLGDSENTYARQGMVESIYYIIDGLGISVVPYAVLLVVPLMGRMSDACEQVRLLATNCFALLICLLPLESGIPDPPNTSNDLLEQKLKERRFLEQLLNPKKLEPFDVAIPIKATLRKYQQDGINWLAFLNKYNLHGILCDDMGLGKTLQTICIVASDHHHRKEMFKTTGLVNYKPLPSLVVCPPTLTGHWTDEIRKFVDEEYLKPLNYSGGPSSRSWLQNQVSHHSVVVASYDIVRIDSEFFSSVHWNYCVLDEGHIIKNGKTKMARAIKTLRSNHRLILSGTPIQNHVTELWSLFDFLMPGFLGTEKQFVATFSKPIIQSRDSKASNADQEAGILAMESLHRQVLPFLLRRLKEDVLEDLPPKIIQDYYCDLSPLQVKLYEEFSRSKAKKLIDSEVQTEGNGADDDSSSASQPTAHVFQALQYLKRLCNHPAMVLTPQHHLYKSVLEGLQKQKSGLFDIQHASKMVALRQLLLDCGIGGAPDSQEDSPADCLVVSQHRALLFCQFTSMLDIIETHLLQKHLPSVTYLRLDGGIPVRQRYDIVQRFNNDPSIDVLLLTTNVGGLGLNLTSADTVIFYDHDWNPMKDLQAMDRAHRIGQKRVVNVYRLITRGTLEEQIMSLQRFKLNIANTVISQENSELSSMNTSQLLDLFSLQSSSAAAITQMAASTTDKKPPARSGGKHLVDELEDLWNQPIYESEYNLDVFINSLKEV